MAVRVKRVTVWKREIPHRAGELAAVLRPLAEAGANLQVVMSYAEGSTGFVELCSVSGKKVTEAAKRVGLEPSSKPTLLVEGDNRPGLGYRQARAIADQGVSISFLVAQVVGKKYSAVFGFHSEEDAEVAARAIKKAGAARS